MSRKAIIMAAGHRRRSTMPAKPKTKRRRPSGVAVTMTKGGSIRMRSFGPNGPDQHRNNEPRRKRAA